MFYSHRLRHHHLRCHPQRHGWRVIQDDLTAKAEIRAVIEAVNRGIDSHLEGCFCPERGDRYDGGERNAGEISICCTLECTVSVTPFQCFFAVSSNSTPTMSLWTRPTVLPATS